LRSRGKPFSQRKDLFFAGNFAHRPNADGVAYFLENVFPLLTEALPEVQFHIAGSSPPPQIQALSSSQVHVMGFVPDIEPFFMNSRVFVAPLRFGAGIKGKIGDSLSHGLPVVTTSIGAKGMGFENGTQVMIADEPEAFAAAVVKLYQDQELWDRLAQNGYVHMEQNFSPTIVEKVIERSVNSGRRAGALQSRVTR
jgi:glycosyltransferase involved in cell wall biosynthesis